MIKIGLLGTQSFHAPAFAKLCNLPDENGKFLFDDVRVVAVCGDDDEKEHLDNLVEETKIENVVSTKEELAELVDAVMILYRRGSTHLESAEYFLEKGIPVWLDKPICSSIEDVLKLKEIVLKTNTLLSGGSTIRYGSDTQTILEYLKTDKLGDISGGVVNHNGDLESPYDGLYFYAPHAVEYLLDIFGYDPLTVKTTVLDNKNLSAAVKYKDKLVIVNINNYTFQPHIVIYGRNEVYVKYSKNADGYKKGLIAFIEELKEEKQPVPFDELTKSIYVIEAILRSIKEDKEVSIY